MTTVDLSVPGNEIMATASNGTISVSAPALVGGSLTRIQLASTCRSVSAVLMATSQPPTAGRSAAPVHSRRRFQNLEPLRCWWGWR